MKKLLAAMIAMMITLTGCSAGTEKEQPQNTKEAEAETEVMAPVGHWMSADPENKDKDYPYVIFVEEDGTGMAFGAPMAWMLRDNILYIEFIGMGRSTGALEFQYAENGIMFLDGLPYVPWKLNQ